MSIRMTMQVLKKVGKNKRLVSSEPSPTFKTLLQNKTTESFITRGVAIVIQPPHAVPGCGGVCARHMERLSRCVQALCSGYCIYGAAAAVARETAGIYQDGRRIRSAGIFKISRCKAELLLRPCRNRISIMYPVSSKSYAHAGNRDHLLSLSRPGHGDYDTAPGGECASE
jgi:hypothetical protein